MPKPNLAIRRHTDRCFHTVEEVVPEAVQPDGREIGVRGYIIQGVLVDKEEVAEVRPIPEGDDGPGCKDAIDSS